MPTRSAGGPATRYTKRKTALITGASRGLGRVLAAFLAKQGYALVIDARTEAELQSAADELKAYGSPVVSILGDVSDPRHRAHLLRGKQPVGGAIFAQLALRPEGAHQPAARVPRRAQQ